jgi:hypothetical protein
MQEVFRVAEEDSHQEKVPPIDWTAIVRNSFLFSQGALTLQTPMLRWLAFGPLYDESLNGDAADEVKKSVADYTNSISTEGRNHSETGPGGTPIFSAYETGKVLKEFSYELDQAFTFSPEELERERLVALKRIAEGFVSRDRHYLIDQGGRPLSENTRRDRHSSFVIDFGILQRGDGFYTWKGTDEHFKKLWTEVMPVIRKNYPEQLREIAIKYVETHPDLSEADKEFILRAT